MFNLVRFPHLDKSFMATALAEEPALCTARGRELVMWQFLNASYRPRPTKQKCSLSFALGHNFPGVLKNNLARIHNLCRGEDGTDAHKALWQ